MLDILSSPYMIRTILAIIFIAVTAAFAGTYTVFRDISFLVAGTSHAALAGASMALVLDTYAVVAGMNPMIGAVFFAVLLAMLAAYAGRHGDRESVNTAIGVGFGMSMSLAILFISMIREYASKAWSLLMGDNLLLTNQDRILMGIMTAVIVTSSLLFHRQFIFISFDMEGASAYGISVSFYNYFMMLLISLSVVVILKGVGAILVFAMLVAPAAAASQIGRSVRTVMALAFLVALVAGLLGLFISFFFNVSPGAVASLLATGFYFLLLALKR